MRNSHQCSTANQGFCNNEEVSLVQSGREYARENVIDASNIRCQSRFKQSSSLYNQAAPLENQNPSTPVIVNRFIKEHAVFVGIKILKR